MANCGVCAVLLMVTVSWRIVGKRPLAKDV